MTFKMTITTKRTVNGVTEERVVKVQNKNPMPDTALSSLIQQLTGSEVEVTNMQGQQAPAVVPPAPKASGAPKASKVTPLIGARDSGFTIGDRIERKPIKGDYVKVLVMCRECGYEDVHDTVFGNNYTKCRGCGEKLHLMNAEDESGVPDLEGNYYVARNRFLTRRERWEMEQDEIAMSTV